jgi:hypothetical protein
VPVVSPAQEHRVLAQRGRVHVFNPQHIAGVPSTFC